MGHEKEAAVRAKSFLVLLLVLAGAVRADYLELVKSYCDTMIEHGRDRYGKEHSPLFATTLDRKKLTIFDEAGLKRLWQIRLDDWENWRFRNRDRMTPGANPMHDKSFYQVLYALTEVTGEKRYAGEADKTIKWFFEHCQGPNTGLMAWGEHMGWDFRTEWLIQWGKGSHHGGQMQEYNTHEFSGPWIFWDKSYELAPEACAKFATGLWDHQIGDHSTGNFSRHANWEMHQTHIDSEYPRHGGFIILSWAYAYEHTKDPKYLRYIEKLTDYFDGRRSKQSDAVPAESATRSGGKILWAGSNLSLAIDLWDGSKRVPGKTAKKMRASAARTDELFLKLDHKLEPGGKGFLLRGNVDTLAPSDREGYTEGWVHAQPANLCLTRYGQVKNEGYKKLALRTAAMYMDSEPPIVHALHPGSLGQIVYLMVSVYELTGDKKYLERADYYAARAVELFFDKDSAFPKATSKHDHYEAVTGSDTLMMSLLRLWAVKNKPDLKLRLIHCDR